VTLFTGHYSFSFAGKLAEKRIPLWLLFVAVQFIEVLWSHENRKPSRDRDSSLRSEFQTTPVP
jgi:hypothetical protein